MQAGVIEETVGDAMDSLDDPELEDAADEEVVSLGQTHTRFILTSTF